MEKIRDLDAFRVFVPRHGILRVLATKAQLLAHGVSMAYDHPLLLLFVKTLAMQPRLLRAGTLLS